MSGEPREKSQRLSNEPHVGVRHSVCGTELRPARVALDGSEIGYVIWCALCQRAVAESEYDPPGAIALTFTE